MKHPLFHRFGLDKDRAIANAGAGRAHLHEEARLVAALMIRLEGRAPSTTYAVPSRDPHPEGDEQGLRAEGPRTWRLRFTVADRPGRLAAASAALAEVGVNILSLDFHVVSPTQVIDEATVTVPSWLDVPALEYALHSTGAVDVWATPIPVSALQDMPVRVLRLATDVISAGVDDRGLCNAVAELVEAEFVSLRSAHDGPVDDGDPLFACDDGQMRFAREPLPQLPDRCGAWTMTVPDRAAAPGIVILAARRSAPFTSTEGARVQALLQLCNAGKEQAPPCSVRSSSPVQAPR